MEPVDLCPFYLEPQQVINDELVEVHQKERGPAQRRSVPLFSLLVTESALDDADAELRVMGVKVIGRVL